MRRYNRNRQNGGKFKKFIIRLLFVVIAAVVITILTILLGSYLKEKAEGAGENTNIVPPFDHAHNDGSIDDTTITPSDIYDVFATAIEIDGTKTEDELLLSVGAIHEICDTVNIRITDNEGRFIYTSPAICDLSRIPYEEDVKFAQIVAVIEAANEIGMRTCIIMTPSDLNSSDGSFFDCIVIKELCDLGADEILITPPLELFSDFTYDTVNLIRDRLIRYSQSVGESCKVGIALPSSLFLDTSSIRQLQMISTEADYLSIIFLSNSDATPEDRYAQLSNNISSLIGNFAIYNMRVLLTESDPEILAAEYSACTDGGIDNISFYFSIDPSSLSYNSSEGNAPSDPGENESETSQPQTDPEDHTNPYSVVDKPQDDDSQEDNKSWY